MSPNWTNRSASCRASRATIPATFPPPARTCGRPLVRPSPFLPPSPRSTGRVFLADLGRAADKVVDHILDLYDIPFVPTMFLLEKKMLYLRFLGANRVVMHRILD